MSYHFHNSKNARIGAWRGGAGGQEASRQRERRRAEDNRLAKMREAQDKGRDYVLVPRSLTQEMRDAFDDACAENEFVYSEVWETIIAAAPPPPAQTFRDPTIEDAARIRALAEKAAVHLLDSRTADEYYAAQSRFKRALDPATVIALCDLATKAHPEPAPITVREPGFFFNDDGGLCFAD